MPTTETLAPIVETVAVGVRVEGIEATPELVSDREAVAVGVALRVGAVRRIETVLDLEVVGQTVTVGVGRGHHRELHRAERPLVGRAQQGGAARDRGNETVAAHRSDGGIAGAVVGPARRRSHVGERAVGHGGNRHELNRFACRREESAWRSQREPCRDRPRRVEDDVGDVERAARRQPHQARLPGAHRAAIDAVGAHPDAAEVGRHVGQHPGAVGEYAGGAVEGAHDTGLVQRDLGGQWRGDQKQGDEAHDLLLALRGPEWQALPLAGFGCATKGWGSKGGDSSLARFGRLYGSSRSKASTRRPKALLSVAGSLLIVEETR